MRTTPTTTTSISTPQPFDLRIALFGHGWIDLAPHAWVAHERTWRTALLVDDGRLGAAVDVAVRQSGRRLSVRVGGAGAAGRGAARAAVARMLRLDLDLEPFWSLCDREPRLAWVRRIGAGRMLRA